jgi:4-amino-4-deoxy-L-arabinose transferase-like glycosyltransferase
LGKDAALWSTTIFATTGLVFVSAGAVMTDPALALGTTLSMSGFWLALSGPQATRRWWGAMFFAGLAIGLLAKGPIAVVLTVLPVGAWTVWNNKWRDVWHGLPWIAGSAAAAVLVVPWYWAAERAAPGFLAYFIIGEHWQRFVVRGWVGDLYGAAHAWPRGMIWVMWLYAILPWSGFPAGWIFWSRVQRHARARRLVGDQWCRYILCWMLAPLLFFTLSRNVLTTYLLPGLPAFALLVTEFWQPRAEDPRPLRPVVALLLAGGIGLLVAFGALLAMQDRFLSPLSGRALVQRYEALRTGPSETLVFVGRRPASAEFYSRGTAAKVADASDPALSEAAGQTRFFAVPTSDLQGPPDLVPPTWDRVGLFGDFALFRAPVR